MEENNNPIKIKFTIIIVLILIVALVIAGVVLIMLNKNTTGTIDKEEDFKTTPIESKKKDTDFTFKFLQMENNKENMVYSPLSIKYALKMLNDGANGNTKAQIESVIGNTDVVKYNNITDILSLANALYIRDEFSQYVKNDYKNKLLNSYNAEIKYDNFKNADNINNWIENKTFGQIKNMLSDETVTNPDNKLFLINALAIDMAWEETFDETNTCGNKFYLEDGEEMTATMMHKETKSDNIAYYKDSNITVLSMDLKQYENEQMEFIAIMPDDDLSNYVENFETDTFKSITNNLTLSSKTKNGLDISIPRFSFDYNLNLENDLNDLGITDAFNPNLADFSNMSSKDHLWIGGALHKANIDFSEKGIKAAAATVIYMTDSAMIADENKPIEIKIDKPFMYLIRDKKTNEIWFVGTVYNPNSWENDRTDYEYR